MRWTRLLDPFRHLRLERENAAMHKQREGDKRGIKSLVDSIGRQAPSGSETELRGYVVTLDGRVHALEIVAGLAREYLRTGRTDAAMKVLTEILDAPADEREAG